MVHATVGKPEDVYPQPRDESGTVRGQAKVVVAQPVDDVVPPEPPHLPVQRTPDEEPKPGE